MFKQSKPLKIVWVALVIVWLIGLVGPLMAQAQSSVSLDSLKSGVKISVTTEGLPQLELNFNANSEISGDFNLQTTDGQVLAPGDGRDLQKFVLRSGLTKVSGKDCITPECKLPFLRLNLYASSTNASFEPINQIAYKVSDEQLSPMLLKLLSETDPTTGSNTYSNQAVQMAVWILYHKRSFDDLVVFTPDPATFRSQYQQETARLLSSVTPTVAAVTPTNPTPTPTNPTQTTQSATPGSSNAGTSITSGNSLLMPIMLGLVAVLAILLAIVVFLVIRGRRKGQVQPANPLSGLSQNIPPTAPANPIPTTYRSNVPPPPPLPVTPYTPNGRATISTVQTGVIDEPDTAIEEISRERDSRNGNEPNPWTHLGNNEVIDEGTVVDFNSSNTTTVLQDDELLLKCGDGVLKGYSQQLKRIDRAILSRLDNLSVFTFKTLNNIEPELLRRISSPHMMLDFDSKNGSIRLVDLNSVNGVFLPDDPRYAATRGRIPTGEVCNLMPDQNGEVRLRAGSLELLLDCTRRTLSLTTGPDRLKTHSLGASKVRRVILSRDPIEIIPLINKNVSTNNPAATPFDKQISAPHALISITSGLGFKIRDLGSANKILLTSGKRVSGEESLNFGEPFRLGQSTFTLLNLSLERDIERLREVFQRKGYEYTHLLGEGGMAKTYLFTRDNKDYAIKIPKPDKFHTDQRYFKAWIQEVGAMNNLNNDEARRYGIVNIIERGYEFGLPYIVMEYVNGVTLKEILVNNKLGQGEAVYIIKRLLLALKYVHDIGGIAHCDITDGNIMLDLNGRVRLTDFGLATRLGEMPSGFGTRYFAAPEMRFKNLPISPMTDIYAIGILVHKLLTKEIPRVVEQAWTKTSTDTSSDPNMQAILGSSSNTEDTKTESSADLSQAGNGNREEILGTRAFSPILRKCISTVPANRYLSTQELLEEITNKPELIEAPEAEIIKLVKGTLGRRSDDLNTL